jgi:dolichyl-phosphate-mannose-protein mannosyltransferase
MSVSLVEDEVGDARPRPSLPDGERERASQRGLAPTMRRLLPRACDALVVVWLTVFHHVLGVKYRFAQIAYDEHYFLNEGWSVLKGQIPYRDFQEFKPPVIFFVNALGIQLFGLEELGYRKFLALLSLASFLALAAALLSRRVHRLVVVAVLMLMIEHFYDDGLHNNVINDAETLALDFFLLGAGVLLTRTTWRRTQLVLGGALLTLSPLSKEPMAFATVGAWLTLLVLDWLEAGRPEAGRPEAGSGAVVADTGSLMAARWASVRRFALYTIAGVAAVVGTWLVYMLVTDSLSWYILQLKLSLAYTKNYAYQLRWASRTPEGGAIAESIRRLRQIYLDAGHLAVFAPFFIALVAAPRKRWMVGICALVTFGLALYAVTVGGGFAPRYFIMAMTGTFLCATLGALALDEHVRRLGRRLAALPGAAWLVVALAMTGPRFVAEWKKYGQYAAPPLPVAASDIAFVQRYTSPGDKIWTTDDPLLYVFSDRESAFRGGIVLDEIIEYYPGDTDAERLSIVRQGLEENRPKLVVFGNTQVSPRRKQRYTRALVVPFLRDGGYIRLNDRFYLRPD